MLSGTLLSDHLTAEEISSLSQHDRTLVRAVKLILPPREEGRGQQRPTDVESLYDGLVGFECSYCSSTPVMEVISSKRRALFKEVFPGSIESMGAALHLLRDKHFSFEASQFQQRCLYLPVSERRIFDQKEYQVFSQSQTLSLQTCCERVARRIGLTNKEASREKSGIILSPEPQQKPPLSTKSADKKRGRDELVGRQESCFEMLPKRNHYSDDRKTCFPYSLGEIGNISSPPQTSQALSPLQEYSSRSQGLAVFQCLSQGKSDATQPSVITQIAPPPVSPYVAPFYARNSGRSHEEAEGTFAGLPDRTISNISHVSPGVLARKRYPISPMSHATATSRQASPLSFIHDGLGWTCPHCLHIPFSLRASGSFHQREPSREEAYKHFRKCQGLQQQPMQSP